jgi:hypothetical protein
MFSACTYYLQKSKVYKKYLLKYSLYFYIAFNYLLISAKPELDLIRRRIENNFYFTIYDT